MIDGLIDTNVFIHAQSRDALAEECLRFLEAVEGGRLHVQLEPLVLHELSYALPHFRKGMTRQQVAEVLLTILSWDGILGEKDVLTETVKRWRDTPGLAFVDAYLASLATRDALPVYTKNAAELRAQGVTVPVPLWPD